MVVCTMVAYFLWFLFCVYRAGGPWLITDMRRGETIFEIDPHLQVCVLLLSFLLTWDRSLCHTRQNGSFLQSVFRKKYNWIDQSLLTNHKWPAALSALVNIVWAFLGHGGAGPQACYVWLDGRERGEWHTLLPLPDLLLVNMCTSIGCWERRGRCSLEEM